MLLEIGRDKIHFQPYTAADERLDRHARPPDPVSD